MPIEMLFKNSTTNLDCKQGKSYDNPHSTIEGSIAEMMNEYLPQMISNDCKDIK